MHPVRRWLLCQCIQRFPVHHLPCRHVLQQQRHVWQLHALPCRHLLLRAGRNQRVPVHPLQQRHLLFCAWGHLLQHLLRVPGRDVVLPARCRFGGKVQPMPCRDLLVRHVCTEQQRLHIMPRRKVFCGEWVQPGKQLCCMRAGHVLFCHGRYICGNVPAVPSRIVPEHVRGRQLVHVQAMRSRLLLWRVGPDRQEPVRGLPSRNILGIAQRNIHLGLHSLPRRLLLHLPGAELGVWVRAL